MIDVLVEASSPDVHAEIADLLRDHSRIRLIESDPDAAAEGESRPQPDVVVVAAEPGQPSFSSRESHGDQELSRVNKVDQELSRVAGWTAAGVPVILLVENPARRIAQPLPPAVRAVLPRNVTPAEIVGAIEAVAAGLYVIHPSDADALDVLRPREPEPAPELAESLVERLTPREIEVLQLLSEGFANKEIAARLNISEHTAKFHVASIMGKLGAASRTEAVTLGIRHGLLMI